MFPRKVLNQTCMQIFIEIRQLELCQKSGELIRYFLMGFPLFYKSPPFPPSSDAPGSKFKNRRECSRGEARSKQVCKVSSRSVNGKFVKNRGNCNLKMKMMKMMRMKMKMMTHALSAFLAIF